MFPFFKAILLLFLVTGVAEAQPSLPAPAKDLSDRLSLLTSQFRQNSTAAPGVVIRIYQPGQWEWSFAEGTRNVSTGTPATPDLVFRAASLSKTICATAVLKLVSERRLSLDDTIGKWLPRSITEPIERSSQITIRRLLKHTSSLDEPQFGTTLANNFLNAPNINYRDSLFQLIGSQQGLSSTIDQFFYSNANFNLLAEIVKTVTGSPYGEYLRQSIFLPLGMTNSYVDTLPLATGFNGYVPCNSLTNCTAPNTLIDYSQANVGWGYGAADVSSTTTDLIRFYYALENGNIIPRNWVDSMKANSVDASRSFSDKRYGYGTMLFIRDNSVFATGHTGTAASHASLLCRLTASDTYICFSFNIIRMNRERFLDELIGVLNGSAVTSVTDAVAPGSPLSPYRIFPNPVISMVNIEIPQGEQVEARIFAPGGQLVRSVLLTSSRSALDLSSMAKGLYYIRLTNRAGRTETKRIILQ